MPHRPASRIPVFDVGNVLIRWNPRNLYRRLFADAARMEWFLANVCTEAWIESQDLGRSPSDAVAALAAEFPEWEAEICAFDTCWQETVPGEIAETVALLARVRRAGVPTYAITNFSREKFAECRERFPFLAAFDGCVVSAHEGLVKPDAAIFRVLLDRYGLDPSDCVFIDDSAANVEGARAVGMTAIRFRADEALEPLLVAAGVALAEV